MFVSWKLVAGLRSRRREILDFARVLTALRAKNPVPAPASAWNALCSRGAS